MVCSLKDKVHKFFYIKRVVGKLWMFPQSWVVALQKQSKRQICKVLRMWFSEQEENYFTLAKVKVVYGLHQRLANFFSNRPDNMYFQLYGPQSLHHNYSTLPMKCSSSHRQHVNRGAGPCPDKTLFIKTTGEPDLAHWSVVS